MSNFQAYGDSEDRFVDDDYPADGAEAEGFLFNVLSVANRDTWQLEAMRWWSGLFLSDKYCMNIPCKRQLAHPHEYS